MDSETVQNDENQANQKAPNLDQIMDLPRLSVKSKITHSDIILSILEICTFNKKYNYECSNNTKAFWDRVVEEGILKKIFKDFKSETLRKYWKNTISSYIITPPKNQNFEDYFISINPKEMKELQKIEPIPEKKEKKQKIKKIEKIEKIEKEENEKEQIDPKILEMGNTIEKLMKMTNSTEENVLRALYGCTGDVKNAYLFLKDNKKYEKYFFFHTDDYIIKNLKNKNYYLDLLNKKGEDNVKIREKFLKKK